MRGAAEAGQGGPPPNAGSRRTLEVAVAGWRLEVGGWRDEVRGTRDEASHRSATAMLKFPPATAVKDPISQRVDRQAIENREGGRLDIGFRV